MYFLYLTIANYLDLSWSAIFLLIRNEKGTIQRSYLTNNDPCRPT